MVLLLDAVNHYKIQLLSHFSASFCTRFPFNWCAVSSSLLLSCCRSSALALPFGLSGSNYPAVLSQNSCRREEGCGLCVRLQAGVAFFACRFTFSLRLHPLPVFPWCSWEFSRCEALRWLVIHWSQQEPLVCVSPRNRPHSQNNEHGLRSALWLWNIWYYFERNSFSNFDLFFFNFFFAVLWIRHLPLFCCTHLTESLMHVNAIIAILSSV